MPQSAKNHLHPLVGFSALLASAAIFGSMGVLTRFLGANFTAFQLIAFRYTLSLIAGGILAILLRKRIAFNSVPKYIVFLYTITFPIEVILWTLSVLQTKILTTTAVFYAGSLLSSLLVGYFGFHEKLTAKKIMSLLLVLVGLGVYLYPFSLDNIKIGVALALLSGFLDTAANSFRKHLSGKMDRLILALMPIFGGVILATLMMAIFHQLTFPIISPFSWFIGSIFGMMLLSISYLTLIGFQNFDLNLGTIVLSTELLFAPIAAYLFLREVPGNQEFVAALFIAMAIVVMNIPWFKKEREKL